MQLHDCNGAAGGDLMLTLNSWSSGLLLFCGGSHNLWRSNISLKDGSEYLCRLCCAQCGSGNFCPWIGELVANMAVHQEWCQLLSLMMEKPRGIRSSWLLCMVCVCEECRQWDLTTVSHFLSHKVYALQLPGFYLQRGEQGKLPPPNILASLPWYFTYARSALIVQ